MFGSCSEKKKEKYFEPPKIVMSGTVAHPAPVMLGPWLLVHLLDTCYETTQMIVMLDWMRWPINKQVRVELDINQILTLIKQENHTYTY